MRLLRTDRSVITQLLREGPEAPLGTAAAAWDVVVFFLLVLWAGTLSTTFVPGAVRGPNPAGRYTLSAAA